MPYSPSVILLLITVVFLLGLAAAAWRFRDNSGVRVFGILQFLSAIWAALAVVGLWLHPGSLRLRIWGLNTGMSMIVVAFWLAFILAYTGRDRLLKTTRIGVASLPLLFGAVLYFLAPRWTPLVGDLTQTTLSAGTVVQSSVGPVGSAIGIYIYVVFLVGLLLVVKSILQSNARFIGQGVSFVLGSLITVAASFLEILGVPATGYPTTEVALGSVALLWGYAVFGQQFLRAVPAVATIGERVVFNDIDTGVIVVDTEGRISRVNPTARSYLDLDSDDGGSIKPVLDRIGISTLADLPARFQLQGQTYQATSSEITNWRDETIGQAVVIQDITSLVRRQQRLQVLNRILRHNVRNDMNLVLGMGEELQKRADDELTAIGETIHKRADEMISISNKAIEIDNIFDEQPSVEGVDIEAHVREIVSSVTAQYPDATISTNVSADEFRTDPGILSLVVEEILTNAVEHSGDAPDVNVEVTRGTDHLELTVADDGPGIPRTEIEPITAGEETNLKHASSLGLWLVYWGTQSLGGDVDFAATEDGSIVTLTLPDLDPADGVAHTQSDAGATASVGEDWL